MTVGNTLTLSSSTGVIERVLVKDLGDVVLICRKEEYQRAALEHRDPVTMAFPRADIIEAAE